MYTVYIYIYNYYLYTHKLKDGAFQSSLAALERTMMINHLFSSDVPFATAPFFVLSSRGAVPP